MDAHLISLHGVSGLSFHVERADLFEKGDGAHYHSIQTAGLVGLKSKEDLINQSRSVGHQTEECLSSEQLHGGDIFRSDRVINAKSE